MNKPATSDPLHHGPEDETVGQADQREHGAADPSTRKPKEIGGPSGPEPTRYGDWEQNGRCTDF